MCLPACGVVTGGKMPTSIVHDGPFTLQFEASASSYRANEPVLAQARFSYEGDDPVAELSGTGSGAILFDVEQLDGDVDQSAFQHDDCRSYELPADQPIEKPFSKSGVYDPESADAAFWRDFFTDPELRLPAGHYRLTARVTLSAGTGCPQPPLDLVASIEIDVVEQ
ncbi:MAG TPA: hypothetical protein VFY43_05805 [Candidatus Limnocylindria bacterium]|nr:hypothetical protein [Candidatus Limnocylindria bacterium]